MRSNNASVVFGISVEIAIGCLSIAFSDVAGGDQGRSAHYRHRDCRPYLSFSDLGSTGAFPVLPPAPPHERCFIDWLPDSEVYIEPYPRIAPDWELDDYEGQVGST